MLRNEVTLGSRVYFMLRLEFKCGIRMCSLWLSSRDSSGCTGTLSFTDMQVVMAGGWRLWLRGVDTMLDALVRMLIKLSNGITRLVSVVVVVLCLRCAMAPCCVTVLCSSRSPCRLLDTLVLAARWCR